MRTKRSVNPFHDDAGAIALVVAILAVALIGLAAIVVDVGMVFAERRSMQTAADSAALAGVQDLPTNPGNARTTADSFVSANPAGTQASNRTYAISSTNIANDTITVHIWQPAYALQLARFLGMNSTPVGARATAIVSSPSAYGSNVMPFGIMSKEPSGTAPFGYGFNQTVTLKQPSGQQSNAVAGNFQFLALTDPPGGHYGANDIRDALRNGGVPNAVYINTLYNTKTGMNGGNVSNALNQWIAGDSHSFGQVVEQHPDGTVSLLDPACHRIIVCPIIVDPGPPIAYNWQEASGTSKPVLVIGFAYMFIEAVGTQGNDCYVTGRFIRPLTPDEAISWGSPDPYGAIGFRLTD